MRRYLVPLIVVIVAAVAVGAFFAMRGGDDKDALTIYSGRSEELMGPIYSAFSEKTGIPVKVQYGKSSEVAVLIGEEGDSSPADVYVSQSPGPIGYLEEREMLATLPESVLSRVPETYRDPNAKWVGVSGRQRVLYYNPEKVNEADLPKSVSDLTKPEWKGKVGLAPSNASFQDFVIALTQTEGEGVAKRWLEGMKANDARPYANNVAVLDAVERGEVEVGLSNHYYLLQRKQEDPSLTTRTHHFAKGDLGNLFLVSPAAVLASSDKSDEARQLLEYLLTDEVQQRLTGEAFEYPLAKGVATSDELTPLDELGAPSYRVEKVTDLKAVSALIAESGLG